MMRALVFFGAWVLITWAIVACVHVSVGDVDQGRNITGITIERGKSDDGQGNNQESVDDDETGGEKGEPADEGSAAEGDN